MLGAFVDLCGLRGSWRMDDFVDEQLAKIRNKCEDGRSVFVLVSGGVDSTVTYALLAKALPPDRILGLYVDTGMMRKGESALVEESLQKAGLPNLRCVDASAQFLGALDGLTAPEAKRRAIGQQFLAVQRDKCKELGLDPETVGAGVTVAVWVSDLVSFESDRETDTLDDSEALLVWVSV